MKKQVKSKHELTPEKKNEIIYYCKYITENFVNDKFKELYTNEIVYVKELFFNQAVFKYFQYGNYELTFDEIETFCNAISQKNQLFQLFKNKKIELVGIEKERLFFGSEEAILNENLNTKKENNINE